MKRAKTMPVPKELEVFFKRLVAKSKRMEINWESTGQPDSYRVRFSDFAIAISQEGSRPLVRVEILNDRGDSAAVIAVEDADEEWLPAVSLINSASRKVRRVGHTLSRAMEELAREGPVGLDAPER